MALIKNYEVTLFEPPCLPGSPRWSSIVKIDADLSDLLPYLNGYLKKRFYDPNTHAIVFKMNGHGVAVRPREIRIGNLVDKDEGEKVAKEVIDFINEIHEKRDEITPDNTRKEPPKAIEIFKLLPKTNCKKCGQLTCMAFASALAKGDVDIDDCPELFEEKSREHREKIEALFMG
ncbi:MAG: Fe-S cluster protein [Deltaproteobacteria bacterium]|nr:MAG: Fe-S cluster protein [Deltaproteobacteria bacterium]